MGICVSENSVISPVVEPIEIQVEKQIDTKTLYKLMISYSWADKEVCHALANRFIEEKFNVWIDRDLMSDDKYTAMSDAVDNSDCILLCVSESYFSSASCQREARYASDRNRTIIPIKVTSNYTPQKWLALIITGKLSFKLSITQNTFDIDYAKIKEEVLKYTSVALPKPVSAIRLQPTKEEIKHRRITYDNALNNRIGKEKPIVDSMKSHIDKIQKSNDEIAIVLAINRWKLRYPQVTWYNFPPFSPTGDINDASFELPGDVKENPGKFLRPWLKDYIAFDTVIPKGATVWRTIGFLSNAQKSTEEIEDRKLLDSDLTIMEERRKMLYEYFINSQKDIKVEENCFCKFAERLKQNIIDFEAFVNNFSTKNN